MNKTRYIPAGYELYKETPLMAVYRKDLTAIAYVGKQSKSTWHYRFGSQEALDEKVAGLSASLEAWEKRKADSKEARKNVGMVGVGTIFHTSWGYNMTMVEFLQVVKETASTVWFEEIGQEVVETTGYMTGKVVPIRDHFVLRDGERKVYQARKRGFAGRPYFTFTERQGGYGRSASEWDGTPCYFNHCD